MGTAFSTKKGDISALTSRVARRVAVMDGGELQALKMSHRATTLSVLLEAIG
jgi:hypothetical protein